MTYVTRDELAERLPSELAAELSSLGAARADDLLALAHDDVDRAIGGVRLPSGRALDPELLADPQVAALKRATVEAAALRLEDGDNIRGATEYLSPRLTVAWRGPRPPGPAVFEILAGHGLLRNTGCAAPTPPPAV